MRKENQLIRKMLLGTKSGVVAWENTVLEATFQTVIGGIVIRISSDFKVNGVTDPPQASEVKLYLYKDEDIIAIWPPFVEERSSDTGCEPALELVELFCEARRKVFRVDQVLDELLAALGPQ